MTFKRHIRKTGPSKQYAWKFLRRKTTECEFCSFCSWAFNVPRKRTCIDFRTFVNLNILEINKVIFLRFPLERKRLTRQLLEQRERNMLRVLPIEIVDMIVLLIQRTIRPVYSNLVRNIVIADNREEVQRYVRATSAVQQFPIPQRYALSNHKILYNKNPKYHKRGLVPF
jgi:hypothetical protein